MAIHFGYYDNWKTAELECPACGWKGTFEQGSVEHSSDLMDSSCPKCGWSSAPMLAIVSYPSIEESEKNWEKLTASEKEGVASRKRFLAEWEAASLKSAGQLPDRTGLKLTLFWDLVEGDAGRLFTVIRNGDTEIWREIACYEGYRRFGEVAQILIEKYGERLADLIPTPTSELYLYGDDIRSVGFVEEIRSSLAAR